MEEPMKRSIIILIVLAALGATLVLGGCGSKKPTLYIFNWSDYIDPDLLREFEQENDCRIRYSTFDSNENMLTKVKSSTQSFDLIFPSGDHVTILNELGLLEEIDKSKLSNYANLDKSLLKMAESFDAENRYAIPYAWGLTGLLYNKDYVPEEIVASGG